MTAHDHVRLLRGLRTIRRYTQDPLPRHVVDDILEVARWTGSASNRQPWELILVRNRETLRAIGGLDGAAGLRHVADAALAVVLVPDGPLTEFDEGRWTERVMLAAAAHGIGASIARVPGEHAATVAAVLGVPAGRLIRTIVSFGYPADAGAHLVSVERDTDHRLPLGKLVVGRKPLTELLHLDRYGQRQTAPAQESSTREGSTQHRPNKRGTQPAMANAQGTSISLQDVVYGFMPAQILHVGARLKVADELAGGARTLAELAAATDTHAPSLRRLLHGLTCLGVLTEPEEDRFELTPAGEQLRADVPNSIRAAVLFFCSEAMWRGWSALEHSVRTGEAAWDHVHGSGFFEYMERHPDQYDVLNAAMADRTRAAVPLIVAGYDFSRFTRLVDVGGGNGQLLAKILTGTPGLRGVLFDQPAGVSDAPGTLSAAGVADRCDVVAGDFFDAVPEGGDAYLLKSVIHNWDDEKATAILRNCRAAMADGGTLLLVERVMPARVESPAFGRIVWSDVNMLVNTRGRERTEAEYRGLFEAAGFELTARVPTSANPVDYQVLVGTPR